MVTSFVLWYSKIKKTTILRHERSSIKNVWRHSLKPDFVEVALRRGITRYISLKAQCFLKAETPHFELRWLTKHGWPCSRGSFSRWCQQVADKHQQKSHRSPDIAPGTAEWWANVSDVGPPFRSRRANAWSPPWIHRSIDTNTAPAE